MRSLIWALAIRINFKDTFSIGWSIYVFNQNYSIYCLNSWPIYLLFVYFLTFSVYFPNFWRFPVYYLETYRGVAKTWCQEVPNNSNPDLSLHDSRGHTCRSNYGKYGTRDLFFPVAQYFRVTFIHREIAIGVDKIAIRIVIPDVFSWEPSLSGV